jgi:hypothetical protein
MFEATKWPDEMAASRAPIHFTSELEVAASLLKSAGYRGSAANAPQRVSEAPPLKLHVMGRNPCPAIPIPSRRRSYAPQ